jgi:RNA recognition motif-containing protein
VDDEGLLEIFEGMNVKEAHVVCKPNGRSKGYGFVTFENEEDQKRALDAVDKTIVEGRDIAVRPALAPFRKSDYPPQQQPVAAPAPAVAAPESAAAAAAPAVAAPAPAAAATEVPAAP